MRFFNYLFFFMAPNFLALATTLENLGARWLLAKKVNFVPCNSVLIVKNSLHFIFNISSEIIQDNQIMVSFDVEWLFTVPV